MALFVFLLGAVAGGTTMALYAYTGMGTGDSDSHPAAKVNTPTTEETALLSMIQDVTNKLFSAREFEKSVRRDEEHPSPPLRYFIPPLPPKNHYISLSHKKQSLNEEDRALVASFQDIVGMSYADAIVRAAEDGYKLHVLYVGSGDKMPTLEEDRALIGIRISDPDYDHHSRMASPRARVTEIIDIGGKDELNLGMVNL